jgi:hypothetical protein
MQPMSRLEATATTQLRALIADLRWRVQLLDADIKEEERKTGVFDPASLAYPILALTLRGRRDNLQATVATLQRRLEAIVPTADWNWAA